MCGVIVLVCCAVWYMCGMCIERVRCSEYVYKGYFCSVGRGICMCGVYVCSVVYMGICVYVCVYARVGWVCVGCVRVCVYGVVNVWGMCVVWDVCV